MRTVASGCEGHRGRLGSGLVDSVLREFPTAPAVDPGGREQVEVAAGTGVEPRAAEELQGVVAADGEDQRGAQAPVLLEFRALHSVGRGSSTAIQRPAERAPDTRTKSVDGIQLPGVDRRLVLLESVEEIAVGGVEGHAADELDDEPPERLRHADLGPEGPAMGADVDQPGRVVLADGNDHGETGAHQQLLLVPRILAQGECGGADEVDGHVGQQVAQSADVTTFPDAIHLPTPVQAGVRLDDVGLAGQSPEIDRVAVSENRSLHRDVGVLDRQRGIDEHAAPAVVVAPHHEVHADRRVDVGPGVEALAECRRGRTEEKEPQEGREAGLEAHGAKSYDG